MRPDADAAVTRVRDALDGLRRKGLAISGDDGLSDEEIDQVARAQAGRALPAAYLAFLRSIGRGPQGFATGMDLFVPELLSVRGAANELLEEMGDADLLPPHAFVFSQYSGSQFLFFVRSPDDAADPDPVVWYYGDGTPGKVSRHFDAFSQYVALLVDEFTLRYE